MLDWPESIENPLHYGDVKLHKSLYFGHLEQAPDGHICEYLVKV